MVVSGGFVLSELWSEKVNAGANFRRELLQLRMVAALVPARDGEFPVTRGPPVRSRTGLRGAVGPELCPCAQKIGETFFGMQPPQVKQHAFVWINQAFPGRRDSNAFSGQIDAVGDDANGVAQTVLANGACFGPAKSAQTRSVFEKWTFIEPGSDPFFPARMTDRPRVEHAVWIDNVGPASAPMPAQPSDRRIHPKAMI